MNQLVLTGRSSSLFTRVARIFALELGVPHTFQLLRDLTALEASAYADNPALKIPVLVDEHGPLFGTENICRELVRRSSRASNVVMRGDTATRVVANAEELTLHVMTSEVSLIMTKLAGQTSPPKVARSIHSSLTQLDETVDAMLAALPHERSLSFVEVTLFCVMRHLPFRDVMDVKPWRRLAAFCEHFEQRESARSTEYRFDAA
jgi:glutathione S-transferase